MLVSVGLVLGGSVAANAATYTTIKLTRLGSSQTVAGDLVSFSGVTPTSLRAKTVTLQRKDQGQNTWVSVGTAKVTAKSTFTVRGKAAGMGQNQWRALYNGKNTYKSTTLVTKVSRWLYLDDLNQVEGYLYEFSTASVGANTYTRGLYGQSWWTKTFNGVYNLSYKCSTFVAGIGLDNESPGGAKAQFLTRIDGVEKNLGGVLGVGTGRAVKVDVSGSFRLTVEARTVAGEPTAIFGNARILCSGTP